MGGQLLVRRTLQLSGTMHRPLTDLTYRRNGDVKGRTGTLASAFHPLRTSAARISCEHEGLLPTNVCVRRVIWVAHLKEWLSFTPHLFQQIKDLPDGPTVSLKVVD